MGVDIGSASSKVVILRDLEMVDSEVVQIGTGTKGPGMAVENIFKRTGLSFEDMERIVVTGYGRFSFEQAHEQISEISCHAKGIHFLEPDARTIIDIGGQDAKAIGLDASGNVRQFFMNDKCAAGTGRFLDVMAKVLNIELSDMQEIDQKATQPATVSSTCTVFAESEVISQLSKGASIENIVAGVHNSVAHKVAGLAFRTGMHEKIVMCGGVARNGGVVRAIREEMKKEVYVVETPQITGALGAAIFAHQKAIKNKEA